jgi:hypothetical protein
MVGSCTCDTTILLLRPSKRTSKWSALPQSGVAACYLKWEIFLPAVAGLLVHNYVLEDDFGALVPALYWPTDDLPQHRYVLQTLGAKALCIVGFAGPAIRIIGYLRWLILRTGRRENVRFILAMFFFVVGSIPPVLSLIYLQALTDSGASTWNKNCFFMPYAP